MGHATLYAAMFSASVLSGMLGVGVGFAAVPLLGIAWMHPLIGSQPVALLLNGVSALVCAICFARCGYVDWVPCLRLVIVTSIFSPIGAVAAKWVSDSWLWGGYFLAIFGEIYLLFSDRLRKGRDIPFGVVLLIGAPVAAVGGMLGVGPGILLVPLMIAFGFNARSAAGITSVAVAISSFLSLIPQFGQVAASVKAALPLLVISAAGAYLGGHLSSTRVSETMLRQLFVALIVALTVYTAIPVGQEELQNAAGYGICTQYATWAGLEAADLKSAGDRPCAPPSPAWPSR